MFGFFVCLSSVRRLFCDIWWLDFCLFLVLVLFASCSVCAVLFSVACVPLVAPFSSSLLTLLLTPLLLGVGRGGGLFPCSAPFRAALRPRCRRCRHVLAHGCARSLPPFLLLAVLPPSPSSRPASSPSRRLLLFLFFPPLSLSFFLPLFFLSFFFSLSVWNIVMCSLRFRVWGFCMLLLFLFSLLVFSVFSLSFSPLLPRSEPHPAPACIRVLAFRENLRSWGNVFRPGFINGFFL